MQISDAGYSNQNVTNNSIKLNVTPSDGSVNVTKPLSGNAQITQVGEGQLFHGQILNVTREQVSILLDNNSTMLARLGDAVNLNIGDSITFQVRENNGDNVVIRPFLESAAQIKDSAIFKVLEGNNLSPTEKNYQIAETLMNNNMPVDKTHMQQIMQQSYKYPDVSIDTLVSMNKLGIPVNSETIGQFQDYMSNSHQMINNLSELSQNISEFSRQMINEIATSGVDDNVLNSELLNFNTTLLGAISETGDMANPETFLNATVSTGEVLTEGQVTVANSDEMVDGQAKNMSELKNQAINNLATRLNVSEEGLNEIFSTLSKAGFSDEVLTKMADNSDTPLKLLNNINELLKSNPEVEIDIKNLFTSESYKELLDKGIKHKFTLDPSEMKDPKEIENLYNKIYDKTNNLMEAFSGKGGAAGENLNNSAKNMQQRLDFMQNLNEMFTYAQLPVKMSSNEANSELFVYLNKKRMQDKKEEVSALLHLDMDHLGPTDVHVSLRGNMVHTKFYVEDEASAKILDDHMNILEKAVNDNGFTLSNEVITRAATLNDKPNMVVDEMLGTDLEQSVKRYSFDVRM